MSLSLNTVSLETVIIYHVTIMFILIQLKLLTDNVIPLTTYRFWSKLICIQIVPAKLLHVSIITHTSKLPPGNINIKPASGSILSVF